MWSWLKSVFVGKEMSAEDYVKVLAFRKARGQPGTYSNASSDVCADIVRNHGVRSRAFESTRHDN